MRLEFGNYSVEIYRETFSGMPLCSDCKKLGSSTYIENWCKPDFYYLCNVCLKKYRLDSKISSEREKGFALLIMKGKV